MAVVVAQLTDNSLAVLTMVLFISGYVSTDLSSLHNDNRCRHLYNLFAFEPHKVSGKRPL